MQTSGAARLDRPRWFIPLLALVAGFPAVRNGFVYDDIGLISNDHRIQSLAHPWEFFAWPFWPDGRLYRPLTSLILALQWNLGGGAPWVYHATSLALYALVCLMVHRVARRWLEPWPAWWTAAIFAAHPVHTEAVAMAVGQAELGAALFFLAAVDRWWAVADRERMPDRDSALVTAFYLIACLFKEHAIMLPAVLLALEATLAKGLGPAIRSRPRLWLALACAAIGFWAVRTVVLRGLVGDFPASPLLGLDWTGRLLTMLGVVPEWVRLLVVPWHLQADYMPQEVPVARGFGMRQLLGLVMLLALGSLAWRTRRSQPVIAGGIAWTGVTLFPVSNVAIATGVLLAERTLFLPSVGLVLAAGAGIEPMKKHLSRRFVRRLAVAFGVLVLVAGAASSAARQRGWRDQETFVSRLRADAPLSYRAHWIHAHQLVRKRDRAGAEREFQRALELFAGDPVLLWEMADRYAAMGRCAEALPLHRRSLGLRTRVLLDRQRYRRCLAEEVRR